MSSKAYLSPLVRKIVLDTVHNLKQREGDTRASYKINTDLVPKVSERVLVEKDLQQSLSIPVEQEPLVLPPRIIPPKPLAPQKILTQKEPQKPLPLKVTANPLPPVQEYHTITPPKVTPTPSINNLPLNELYRGKLSGLLADPSVVSIECTGHDVPINIFRAGQKQRTRIILSKTEIDRLLNEISKQVQIPLSDGIFRVIVNNLMINAVISELVGTRFVIKKLFAMDRGAFHG
jgi:hypothetical protein